MALTLRVRLDSDLKVWLHYSRDGDSLLDVVLTSEEVCIVQQALTNALIERDRHISKGLEKLLSEGA